MIATHYRSNFIVQHEIWAGENNQLVRYVELALKCIDKKRTVYFPFEQQPLLNGEGGTLGKLPAFRVLFPCADQNACREVIQNEQANPKLVKLSSIINEYAIEKTCICYEKITVYALNITDITEYLNAEELNLLRKKITPPDESEEFYLLSNASSCDWVAGDCKFEVQHIFWAQPGLENIALKIAKFISSLDERSSLYCPLKEGPSEGELPTFLISQDFLDFNDYKNRIETEQNVASYSDAFKFLKVCCKNQTRQFWKLQTVKGNNGIST